MSDRVGGMGMGATGLLRWSWGLCLAGCIGGALSCSPKQRDYSEISDTSAAGRTGMQTEVQAVQPAEGSPGDSPLSEGLEPEQRAADAAGVEGTANTELSLLENGSVCSEGSQCSSSFCVEGVCCNSSCNDVCTSCALEGTEGVCTLAGFDAACGGRCPAGTQCRSYPSGPEQANCDGAGLCRASVTCSALDEPETTRCGVGDAGSCDGQGACVVPNLATLGEGCGENGDCAEGHCVPNALGELICCDAACEGVCEVCGDTGRCDAFPASDAACEAVDCPGDSVCRDYDDDFAPGSCRGFGECFSEVDCQFEDLRPGECACDADGSCELLEGRSCSADGECRSESCQPTVDAETVCCAADCDAQGLRCSRDGTRCVECEGTGSECQGLTSVSCRGEVLNVDVCANGCSGGACNGLRSPGQICSQGPECATGNCSSDLFGTQRCCSPNCEASGRVCGTEGGCVCPADRVEVNGQCLLRQGQACADDSACGRFACSPSVGGGRVCCTSGCPGELCSRDGASCLQCEGSTSRCQGNTSQRCQNQAFVSTQCGNGCNAATGQCNGLLGNGQSCANDASCGSGICDLDQGGTRRCCEDNCANSGRSCGASGSCVCPAGQQFIAGACRSQVGSGCGGDSDCASNACEDTQGGASICCTSGCGEFFCRSSGSGCVECEGNGAFCQGNASRVCSNNTLGFENCANGCNQGTGRCNALLSLGQTGCQSGQQCQGGDSACVSGRCCEFNCEAAGMTCGGSGQCECPPGSVRQGNVCLLANGERCVQGGGVSCLSGLCSRFFPDEDNDGFGDSSAPEFFCGGIPPERAGGVAFVVQSGDCCDRDSLVFPGQFVFFGEESNCSSFDYNCDGLEEQRFTTGECRVRSVEDCSATFWSDPVVPPCGETGGNTFCGVVSRGPSADPVCTAVNGISGAVSSCH